MFEANAPISIRHEVWVACYPSFVGIENSMVRWQENADQSMATRFECCCKISFVQEEMQFYYLSACSITVAAQRELIVQSLNDLVKLPNPASTPDLELIILVTKPLGWSQERI